MSDDRAAQDVVLQHHFADTEQQRAANRMGMWIFLGTELMLFGGIFLGFLTYRVMHPEGFQTAASHTDLLIGTVNTAVLLTSSLTVAIAVAAARARNFRVGMKALGATLALGAVFLMLKGWEYHKEYVEGLIPGAGKDFPLEQEGTMLFWNLYFAATGLHAVHLTVALCLVAWMMVLWKRGTTDRVPEATEAVGLYWHLVDVIWVWLYPLIYLAGR